MLEERHLFSNQFAKVTKAWEYDTTNTNWKKTPSPTQFIKRILYEHLLLYILNMNVSLLWPIMKAAVHFIIHVNGQQRVGTHSGQVGHFYEYHLMIFSFGQQNQVSTTKSNNCIIVFKEKIFLALCKSKVLTPLTKPFKMNHFSLNVGRPKNMVYFHVTAHSAE